MSTGKTPISEPAATPVIRIRQATSQDAQICGRICYEAFAAINTHHGFPPDLPSPEVGTHLLATLFSHPGFYCVVAELDGRIAASNCLDERSTIAGVGPITIEPSVQNRGIGRALMKAVIDRAREQKFPGVRLLQAAFHNRSLSLYSTLHFDVREPISTMQGPPIMGTVEGCTVRPAKEDDLPAANLVCEYVHGHNRAGELRDAVTQGTASVVERQGRITGYASAVGFFGHAVGESNLDVQALIAAAPRFEGPGILIPSRNAQLLRWCLANNLRVVYPMTLMSMGLYNEPRGAYLPSILY